LVRLIPKDRVILSFSRNNPCICEMDDLKTVRVRAPKAELGIGPIHTLNF
jgi:hypothetical protein